MRSKALLFSAALAAVALAFHPAGAQSHRAVITGQLDTVTVSQAARGFRPASVFNGQTVIGMLPKGGSVILELNLRAGVQYFIPAGCDTDCDDLDTRLLSSDGQTKLDEDVEDDDVPMLSFTPSQSGPHLIAVMMASCKTDLCYFGFRVLAKQ